MEHSKRRILAHWLFWFFASNALLLGMIAIGYSSLMGTITTLPMATAAGRLNAWIYSITAFLSQMILFAAVPGLLLTLFAIIVPRPKIITCTGVLLATFVTTWLITDVTIFHLYHYHLDDLWWRMVQSGVAWQVLDLSSFELFFAALAVVGVLLLQGTLAVFWWQMVQRGRKPRFAYGLAIVVLGLLSLIISAGLYKHATKARSLSNPLTRDNQRMILRVSRLIPLYPRGHIFSVHTQKPLRMVYPKRPLPQPTAQKRLNIVIIAIDSWRFDMLNARATPNIEHFAKQAWQFRNHFSGGNATQDGLFSLFYSIPGTYWHAVKAQHVSPVFINQLRRDHYQFGIFASASLAFPAFNKTIFNHVPNVSLNTPGTTPAARDQKITAEFQSFLQTLKTNKPFFSFLFYDETHDWCGSSQQYLKPFQPAVAHCERINLNKNTDPAPYLNRYRNALHFDDGLIGKDIAALRAQGLLKNTVVIITSDHGEQFNDQHLGIWGHGSAFDRFQTEVPFIVYWPGKKPRVFRYKTSHYDLVPTLMRQALGIHSAIKNYSAGEPLLTQGHRPFLLLSSPRNYAILTKHFITTIYPDGDYQINMLNGHPDSHPKLSQHLIQAAVEQMQTYYH